jgi:hypothetical protein
MHKWYDPRLFDVMSHSEILLERGGSLSSATTADELLGAGIDVRFFGGEMEGPFGEASCNDAEFEVTSGVFCKWLERSEFTLGNLVVRWWVGRGVADEASTAEDWKHDSDATVYDLFLQLSGGSSGDGPFTVKTLCRELSGCGALTLEDPASYEEREDLVERLLEEMVAVASLAGGMETGAIAQGGRTAAEEDAEAEQVAERLAYGWPDVDDEPTNPRLAGRFAKSFPLLYPMGVADMHDERAVKVSPHEYVQHMMRLPWTWETSQGPRLLWALVNTVLLHEARGKGFAVYRAALLPHGWRLSTRQVLTRGQ